MMKLLSKSIIAIILGFFVLMISSMLMMYFSKNSSLFENYHLVRKGFMHLSMITMSLILILLINGGNLHNYGFKISFEFDIIKILIISIALGFFSSYISNFIKSSGSFSPTSDFTFIHKILFVIILASIAEEVLTRGLIQGYLSPFSDIDFYILKIQISLPVFISALFFGAMHLMLLQMGVPAARVIIIVIFGFILGIIAGYMRESTNSLFPAIIVHSCFNIGAYLFILIKGLFH